MKRERLNQWMEALDTAFWHAVERKDQTVIDRIEKRLDTLADSLDDLYRDEIEQWDWAGIIRDCRDNVEPPDFEGDDFIGSTFIGTVTGLAPSGKLYAPWSAVSPVDRIRDEIFFEALDAIASDHNVSIGGSEGDGNDLIASICIDPSDVEPGDETETTASFNEAYGVRR